MLAIAAMAVLASGGPSGGAAVVRVNGVELAASLLDREVAREMEQRRTGGAPAAALDEGQVRAEVLERLIDNELMAQAAATARLVPAQAAVDAEMAKIRGQFGDSSRLEEALKAQGTTPAEVEAQVRRWLAIRLWAEREVEAQVTSVPEAEVRRYYEANRGAFQRPEAVRVRHVMARVGAGAAPEARAAARRRAEAALKRIRAGEDFAAVAREVSEDQRTAAQGGDLGELLRGQLGGPFEDAAFALAAGAVSEVVESQVGFHVIQCVARTPAGPLPFERVADGIREELLNAARAERVKRLVAELRAKAKIERP